MTDRELMQEALYALTYVGNKDIYSDTIESLRARLAQPEQQRSEQWWRHEVSNAWAEGYEKGRLLQREWQGLTEAERIDIVDEEIAAQNTEHFALAQAIEAKLKEKNT